MKLDGSSSTFAYSSPFWTNSSLLNPNVATLGSHAEAKLQPFLDQPLTEVRMMMTMGFNVGTPLILDLPSAPSLRALFSGGEVLTTAAPSDWHALIPGGATHQRRCNYQGANVQLSMFAFGGQREFNYRLGIVMNQETDCSSPDSGIGIGGSVQYYGTPNYASGQFVGGPGNEFTFGSIYTASEPGDVLLYVRGAPASFTATASSTPDPTPSETAEATPSRSETPEATPSRSVSVSPPRTQTRTPSRTRSETNSPSQTGTSSSSGTGTASSTSSGTPSSSVSGTASSSSTGTPSSTATGTPSGSTTPSGTATATRSPKKPTCLLLSPDGGVTSDASCALNGAAQERCRECQL